MTEFSRIPGTDTSPDGEYADLDRHYRATPPGDWATAWNLFKRAMRLLAALPPQTGTELGYVIFVDGDKYVWKKSTITGTDLHLLAGIPKSAEIFLKVLDQPDERILDHTVIEIVNRQGPARFSTQAKGSFAGTGAAPPVDDGDNCPTCGAPASHTPAGSNHVVGDWNEEWEYEPPSPAAPSPEAPSGHDLLLLEMNLARLTDELNRIPELRREDELQLAKASLDTVRKWRGTYIAARVSPPQPEIPKT